VRAPIQRKSRDENVRIKAGEVLDDWNEAKHDQKDVDVRWTKKHGKNHINVDAEHKLVRDYEVTAASVQDSQVFDEVIDPDNVDPEVWADSVYRSEGTEVASDEAVWYPRKNGGLQQGGFTASCC